MIVKGGYVTCEYPKGRETELTQGEVYKVVAYNGESNLIYLEGLPDPFCATRFCEYWQ